MMEFKELTVDEQVKFINEQLQKNKSISVTNLFKKFGLNKSTMLSRFKRHDYSYNIELRQYIKNNVIQKDNKDINNLAKEELAVTMEVTKNNIYKLSIEEVKELRELLQVKDQLLQLIQKDNISKNTTNTELTIDRSLFSGMYQNRLIKVAGNINKRWIKFCKNNSQYKMQDLYSLALLEFMEKYE